MQSFSFSNEGYISVLNGVISNTTNFSEWVTEPTGSSATQGTTTISEARVVLTSGGTAYNDIKRAWLRFDTTSLPDDQYVTDAYITVKVQYCRNTIEDPDTTYWSFVDFTPANPASIAKEDLDLFSDSAYYTYSFSEYTEGSTYTIPIDPNLIHKDGYTLIGFRTEYDRLTALNGMNTDYWPPLGVASGTASIGFQYSPAPVLYVVYGTDPPVTPTPTPYPGTLAVNLLEKYSNAALVNQDITITPTSGGSSQTQTSLYGETLHFGVVPGMEYWFNASRPGYADYNETYTIPATPGIYTVYMERTLTPIANHSYAHFSVVDQTNGGLIPNAEIRLSDGQTKLTNSAGYTWFSVNNSEQINYYVSKPSGYWPAYGAMNLTADESILVALQRYTGPTATATMPGWTPVTVPTTGTGSGPVVTLSAQLREQNVQEGMDVWYTNLPFISQFLFLLFIIGGLGLMAGGTRRN
jgi:hypothetical protein